LAVLDWLAAWASVQLALERLVLLALPGRSLRLL